MLLSIKITARNSVNSHSCQPWNFPMSSEMAICSVKKHSAGHVAVAHSSLSAYKAPLCRGHLFLNCKKRSNRCPTESVYIGLKFLEKHAFGTVIYACKLFYLQYRLWYANSVEEQSNLTCFFISWRDDLHENEPRNCNAKMTFVIMAWMVFERGNLEWIANATRPGVFVVRNLASGK